jgi:hypothetical protein
MRNWDIGSELTPRIQDFVSAWRKGHESNKLAEQNGRGATCHFEFLPRNSACQYGQPTGSARVALEIVSVNGVSDQPAFTHPEVGALTALAFVLIPGKSRALSLRPAGGQLSGAGALGGVHREPAALGAYHQTGEFDVARLARGSGAGEGAQPAASLTPRSSCLLGMTR